MPSQKVGKDFESIFRDLAELEGIQTVRFYDVTNGYKGIDNPADFVISKGREFPSILIETKVCQKSSFKLDFRQRKRLSELTNFRSFVVIWFTEYKKVLAFDIDQINLLISMGYKSISPNRVSGLYIDLCNNFNRVNPQRLEVLKLWKDT